MKAARGEERRERGQGEEARRQGGRRTSGASQALQAQGLRPTWRIEGGMAVWTGFGSFNRRGAVAVLAVIALLVQTCTAYSEWPRVTEMMI